MKKLMQIVLTAIILSTLAFSGSASNAAKEAKILEFDTMVGVPAGLTGPQSQIPLRGINGGRMPRTLSSASGELSESGYLEINVEGLVLATGANAGTNPAAIFRGLVSCVTST